jgi:tetratricopeptide (TPR) repeat protein
MIRKYQQPNIENPGYVGPQACAECHQHRFEECRGTSHFQTCRVPELSRLPRGFKPGQGTFKKHETQVEYESLLRDERPVQIAKNGRESYQQTASSIDLILGAKDISDEVYLSWHQDNSMWELPVAWVFARDAWGASGFDKTTTGGDHARPLTLRCLECHNTWFEHMPGTLNVYRRENFIRGVTCERCHGPGSEHVVYHQQNPNDQTAQHIVYPANLDRERLIEVCTQCHGNAVRHRGPALSYRPGLKLDDHYFTTHPPHSEDDHVANQIGNIRGSPCFQSSQMTCITCHDPHLTDKPSLASYADTCKQCHNSVDCGQQAELPESLRDKCSECHMRKYVKINVNFDLENELYVPPILRSQHRIAKDPVATQEILLEHARKEGQVDQASELEKRLVMHWRTVSQECESQQRYVAAIAAQREILRFLPNSQEATADISRLGQLQHAIDDLQIEANRQLQLSQDEAARRLFNQLIELKPTLAEAHSRLGTIAAKANDYSTAKLHLLKSIELAPEDQYGFTMLARLAFVEKQYDQAISYYQQAAQIEPYNAKLNWLWGQALQMANRSQEAVEHWQLSLKIDPRQPQVLRALCEALANSDQASQAIEYAEVLNSLGQYQDLNDIMLLAQIRANADQPDAASSVVRQALKVAKQSQPQAIPAIEQWAREQQLPMP